METKKMISNKIESKLGFTNGWAVDRDRYKFLCDEVAEEITNYINRKLNSARFKPKAN